MQSECDGVGGIGDGGSGSVESDLGGEYVQGYDCVSVFDVSSFL